MINVLRKHQIEKAVCGAHGNPDGIYLAVAPDDLVDVRGYVQRETLRQGWTYTTRYDKVRRRLHVTVGL